MAKDYFLVDIENINDMQKEFNGAGGNLLVSSHESGKSYWDPRAYLMLFSGGEIHKDHPHFDYFRATVKSPNHDPSKSRSYLLDIIPVSDIESDSGIVRIMTSRNLLQRKYQFLISPLVNEDTRLLRSHLTVYIPPSISVGPALKHILTYERDGIDRRQKESAAERARSKMPKLFDDVRLDDETIDIMVKSALEDLETGRCMK